MIVKSKISSWRAGHGPSRYLAHDGGSPSSRAACGTARSRLTCQARDRATLRRIPGGWASPRSPATIKDSTSKDSRSTVRESVTAGPSTGSGQG